ncbi:MAG TPA: hypothetical protein VIV65_06980 [Gemmatimonadaceae bacterium]|jgi:hypothetical protein
MIRTLKISLAAFALVGLATTFVPQASAWTCVGYGTPGGQIAQACNQAHATADQAIETALETGEYVIQQAERCVPGLNSVQWTCVHYP